ncbi:hypothetical protein [Embleya sp. MST-111070]|uniref:hypothetical protein n=1 Tax=Embleya sp. MST-111070 TaxID=3398231 RepID=UPI003F73B3B6
MFAAEDVEVQKHVRRRTAHGRGPNHHTAHAQADCPPELRPEDPRSLRRLGVPGTMLGLLATAAAVTPLPPVS